jgi:hypothetical protein
MGLYDKITRMQNPINTTKNEISQLIKEGNYKQALVTLNKQWRPLFESEPAYVISTHFALLFEMSEPLLISKTLDLYKGLPYISQEIEELLKAIEANLHTFFTLKMNDEELDNKIITLLQSDNINLVAKGIYLIKKNGRNPLDFFKEIEQAMLKEYEDNLCLIVIPLLQSYMIDKPLKILHQGEVKTVIVSAVPRVDEDKVYMDLIVKINRFYKDVSVAQIATQLAKDSYEHNYPFGFEKVDIEPLSYLFILQAKLALGQQLNEQSFLDSYGITQEMVGKLVKKYHLALYQG